GGKLVTGDSNGQSFSWGGFATDTRQDVIGKLFIALRGEKFDAHDFVSEALAKGASGLLVSRFEPHALSIPVVLVDDTLIALQKLALFWRKKNSAKIVAITGSAGKTTTKEFTTKILQKRFCTHASKGSYNNHWGVPLSLLGIGSEHQVAVVEMGMNHSGEITRLCKITEPDVTLVTNVGSAHIGELGSQEAIVQAKWEIFRASPHSIQIFNLADRNIQRMYQSSLQEGVKKIFTFTIGEEQGSLPNVDVRLSVVENGLDYLRVVGHIGGIKGEAVIKIFGRHNIGNVIAAATVGLSLGMPAIEIWQALKDLQTIWGRNQIIQLASGARALFDGYNANPESMAALLDNISQLSQVGDRFLILAEMLELGEHSSRYHEELGFSAGKVGAEGIWFMGEHQGDFAAGVKRSGYSKRLILSDAYKENLATQFGSMLKDNDIVAIKGSRGMRPENVLRAWGLNDF
ncbi:MAG: UDP-N-acetylmuramoyl-tripeptide--D-alanyl-D-alanine ligase, partial [Bdellovibrionales bacterium]|nr:UDP-N-acetylmuramoyl-tripeptide--D-alanyl-D-alanine ligase [Bdellovibrionales bacterium]